VDLYLKNIFISFSTEVISGGSWEEFQWKKDGSSSKTFWVHKGVWELFEVCREFKCIAASLNNFKALLFYSCLSIQTVLKGIPSK